MVEIGECQPSYFNSLPDYPSDQIYQQRRRSLPGVFLSLMFLNFLFTLLRTTKIDP
nr:MAG TPA: hypothetical protein [Caudoviricetes sp.]